MRAPAVIAAALAVLAGCASADSHAGGAPGGDTWVGVDGATGRATAFDAAPAWADGAAKGGDQGPALDMASAGPPPPSIGLTLPGPQNIAHFRALLDAGVVPSAQDLSMAGWLNEHDTVLPAASPDRPVDLHPLAAIYSEPGGDPEVLLQLGFNTAASLQALQPSVDLAVIVDRSASMGPSMVAAIADGVLSAADNLPANSALTVIAAGTTADAIFEAAPYKASDRTNLSIALADLGAKGGTDLYAAVALAQQKLAAQSGAKKRILLASDGASTRGGHSNADLVALATKGAISVSTVAVGMGANTLLLGKIALVTGGTHIDAPTAAAVRAAFTTDLATLLVPVATNLLVKINLAAGWTLRDSYGLPAAQSGAAISLGASDAATGGGDATSAPDVGAADIAGQDASVAQPAAALVGQLYPSGRNSLLVLRLQPPKASDVHAGLTLVLATAQWKYTLAASGETKSHSRPVEVSGLVTIPDGGLEFYTHPVARRTLAIVRTGETLREACALSAAGNKAAAVARLVAVRQFISAQAAHVIGAELDPGFALDDAHALAAGLEALLQAP